VKLVSVSTTIHSARIGRLSHTASSIVWSDEPGGILELRDLDTASQSDYEPEIPPNTVASWAWSSFAAAGKKPESALLVAGWMAGKVKGTPSERLWSSAVGDLSARMVSTRPSIRMGVLKIMLELIGKWEETGDTKYLQGLNFNRLPPLGSPENEYRPNRTALIRSTKTMRTAITNSPRFRPDAETLTGGRMDYEGMCEVLWSSTRSTHFECWRVPCRS